MRTRFLSANFILAGLIVLTACHAPGNVGVAQVSGEPAPSASISIQPSPTSPATPTETRVPTTTATPSPYPSTPSSQPTPDLFHSPVAQDILFGGDATCKLPCWYGLRVGESRAEDIQNALRNALGASPDYVFVMGDDPQITGNNSGYIYFRWQEGNTSATHLFSISANFNPQTEILSDLQIDSTHPFFLEHARPQRILKELGAPSVIWVDFQPTERADIADLNVAALYSSADRPEETMYASWIIGIPVYLSQGSGNSHVAKWCLDGASDQTANNFRLRIPPGFDLASTDMRSYNYAPLEEVFGITPEALYQQVLKEDNTCLSHEY